ncbi:MAG: hypothetical protein FJX18_00090 [Alphaproteobacteria bacterium]|nr:hypothetical protein [Alphaproteobacteria bacterium]
MSSIKHSTISFLLSTVFSKALIPFLGILYGVLVLKSVLNFWSLWILSGFSFLSFGFILGNVLKNMRIRYARKDLWFLGMVWAFGALIIQIIYEPDAFESFFCFSGPWIYLLIALFFAPRFCGIYARQWAL